MKTLLALLCAVAMMAAPTADADESLDGVATLVFAGKTAEARPRLESALASYRTDDDAAGEGIVLVLLGMADVSDRKVADARIRLAAGATKLQEAGDVISAMIAMWALVELDSVEGKVDAALAGYEKALAMLTAAAEPGSPFTLEGFRILAPAIGLDPTMLGPLLLSPEIMKPILLSAIEAMMRDSYGAALTDAGKLDRAEQELTRAQAAGMLFGGMFDSSIEKHLGHLRRRQWRFAEARAHYAKALDELKPMPGIPSRDDVMSVRAIGDLSEIEFLSGNTEDALRWNDKALARVRPMNMHRMEASLLEDRGGLLMRAGRFSGAEKTYRQALAIAEKIGSVGRQATTLSSLGSLYQYRGELGTSAATFEKSLALFGKADLKEAEAATWLSLAEVYMTLGTRDTGRSALDRARALAKESDFKLALELIEVVASADRLMSGNGSIQELDRSLGKWWELPETKDLMLPEDFRVLMRGILGLERVEEVPDPAKLGTFAPMVPMANLVRGKKLFQEGNLAGARALWMKALAENDNHDLEAAYLAVIGVTYWKEANEDEAIRYFDRAVAALGVAAGDVKVEQTLAGYLGGDRRWYFDIAIEALARKGRYEEAFDHSERARARAFLHSLGNARLQPARGASPELVREAEALRKSIEQWERDSAFRPEITASDLRNARRQYQSLLERVKVSNPEYASLTTVEPMRIADVQRTLPGDTTLVSFFVSPFRVHAWVIDRDSMKPVSLNATAAQLQKAVCWAAGFGGTAGETVRSMQPGSGTCADTATDDEVYDLLVAPLRPAIRNQRLILVPHGVLHYLPFAAMRDRESGRRLLEDYTITYAPGASALRFLAEKETPVDGGALVMGDPATPRERLSGAQREAAAIGRAIGTEPAVGAAAKEGLLYTLGGKYDLVHIGAHGEYNPGEPVFSRIALAPDDVRDGNLEVHEILSDVDLTGVNLVVLSACGTARGARSGGDEIVGLTRAVLYAGATGVISTLWDIDDEAAADLMEVFYGRLLEGVPAAGALRDAQLATMRRAPYADPRFWAAFQLSGNPQGRWSSSAGAAPR